MLVRIRTFIMVMNLTRFLLALMLHRNYPKKAIRSYRKYRINIKLILKNFIYRRFRLLSHLINHWLSIMVVGSVIHTWKPVPMSYDNSFNLMKHN